MEELKEYTFYDGRKVKMLKLDDYYLHSTGYYNGYCNHENNIISILKTGYIWGNQYVCLCDTRKNSININGEKLIGGIETYVDKSPTICLNRNIEVYDPIYINKSNFFFGQSHKTDIYNEVRHNGNIKIDEIELITFPIWPVDYELKSFSGCDYTSEIKDDCFKINNLRIFRNNIEFIKNNYSFIPVRDLYTGDNLSLDYVEERIKEYKK